MGKKRRILTNPRKFGKKHFEILDNMDGTNDDVISLSTFTPTLRTLGLVDNGDRTVSVTAELFGSGSNIQDLKLNIEMTGSEAVAVTIGLDDIEGISSSGSTGFIYTSSLPAVTTGAGANPYVFPAGRAKILGRVYNVACPADGYAAQLTQAITISAAPIGLTSAQLSGALSGALDGSTALSVDLTAMEGTAPQHGSGSGVGAGSSNYAPDNGGSQHGYLITVSGTVNGPVNLAGTATANNGHSNSGVVVIADQTNMNASGSQDITITFTPRDVNNQLSTDQAVTTTLTLS